MLFGRIKIYLLIFRLNLLAYERSPRIRIVFLFLSEAGDYRTFNSLPLTPMGLFINRFTAFNYTVEVLSPLKFFIVGNIHDHNRYRRLINHRSRLIPQYPAVQLTIT